MTVIFQAFSLLYLATFFYSCSGICECPNPPEIALNGNFHIKAPLKAKKKSFPRYHVKENGHSYLFMKLHVLDKCVVVELYGVEVYLKFINASFTQSSSWNGKYIREYSEQITNSKTTKPLKVNIFAMSPR